MNYAIDFLRYYFMLFICLLHFKEYYGEKHPFGGGYLAVEFFFVLSGFLLVRHYKKNAHNGVNLIGEKTLEYLLGKYKTFIVQYWLSLILLLSYCIWRKRVSLWDWLVNGIPEFFMLQMTGLGNAWRLNPALWYISALIFGTTCLYFLLLKNENMTLCLIAPLISVLVYSHYWQKSGQLGGVAWSPSFVVLEGFMRGMAGLGCGCISYNIWDKWYKNFNRLKGMRSVVEILFLGTCCYRFVFSGNNPVDFLLIIGFMGLIIDFFAGDGSYFVQLLKRQKIRNYTYAIYCNHWLVNLFIKELFPNRNPFIATIIYLVITFILSVLTTKLVSFIRKGLFADSNSACNTSY